MKDAFLKVAEFERNCLRELSENPPCFSDTKLGELRRRLIREEYLETIEANDHLCDLNDTGATDEEKQVALAELADGLADLIFVAIGTALTYGIDLAECWDRVCKANLAKFAPGHWYDENMKLRKPPGWVPPDILGVIKNQKSLRALYGNTTVNEESQG